LIDEFGVSAAHPKGDEGGTIREDGGSRRVVQLRSALGDEVQKKPVLAGLGEDRFEVANEVLGFVDVEGVEHALLLLDVASRESRELLFGDEEGTKARTIFPSDSNVDLAASISEVLALFPPKTNNIDLQFRWFNRNQIRFDHSNTNLNRSHLTFDAFTTIQDLPKVR
jgi:hypothetical protein